MAVCAWGIRKIRRRSNFENYECLHLQVFLTGNQPKARTWLVGGDCEVLHRLYRMILIFISLLPSYLLFLSLTKQWCKWINQLYEVSINIETNGIKREPSWPYWVLAICTNPWVWLGLRILCNSIQKLPPHILHGCCYIEYLILDSIYSRFDPAETVLFYLFK
jgi:hypothetical protein